MATLYRKYRSKTFDDVIGQDPIVTTLTNQIKLGRIGHAYLFSGSRGIGKTSCARIFARAVNCLHPINGSPCGECEVCKKLDAPDNVDIIELDAASNNGVDDARDIREKVKYLPVCGKYKVYIIDEVHMLTGGAFNALLKTIEEPPEHVIFILATTEPQKLPQTILSRCVRFDFRLVPTDVLSKHIQKVYDAEGIKYTKDAADEIARLGEGSVRDALSIADTLGSAADVVTPEIVLALTGAGDSTAISELFDRASARDIAGCLNAVDTLAKSGKSMSAVVRQLETYARNALVIKSVGYDKALSSGLLNVDRTQAERLKKSCETCDIATCAKLLESFSEAENGLKYSVSPRLYLETSLVKLTCDDADDLRKRVAALEKRLSATPVAEQKKNIDSAPQKSAPIPPKSIPQEYDYEPPPEPDAYARRIEKPTPTKVQSTPPKAQSVPRSAEVKYTPVEIPKTMPKKADEGEFMHVRSDSVSGLELLGKIATYLRKSGDGEAARVRELLSRGVAVKEREDVTAFVVPDDSFLLMSEKHVVGILDEALKAVGVTKPASIEKTDEDLYADDLARARELFGRDNVVGRNR
ncbi:MAG: DNA polymerase III subunit gamma/tau [Clostridiales bacterium]|nr:DNA polymerase III subunit gamma/tau [Clostridiales bacterium]